MKAQHHWASARVFEADPIYPFMKILTFAGRGACFRRKSCD